MIIILTKSKNKVIKIDKKVGKPPQQVVLRKNPKTIRTLINNCLL